MFHGKNFHPSQLIGLLFGVSPKRYFWVMDTICLKPRNEDEHVVKALQSSGWEFGAHGLNNSQGASHMSRAEEEAYFKQTFRWAGLRSLPFLAK